ncbi:MAG: family acetyltransferase [Rhizobacter sp.]|nr:family acetyltransferase [Rhizobacter sp.]
MVSSEGSPERSPEIQLIQPQAPHQLDATRAVISEYVASLGIDLQFQNVDDELAALPGEYSPPLGRLLLATIDGEIAGCGAFRPITDVDHANACEMKRLYVRKAFRRFGLGRVIAQALMDHAREVGYSVMLLDTLDEMESARGLYTTLGFEEVAPYYFNPIAGSHYLKAAL